VVEKISFDGADSREKTIKINAGYVRDRLKTYSG